MSYRKEAISTNDPTPLPEGTYLIPRAITRGYQIVPGVGVRDALFPAAGLVLGITLWIGLHAVGVPFVFRGLATVIPILVGGVLALPIEEVHIWEFVRDVREFQRVPRTLYYDWTREDW